MTQNKQDHPLFQLSPQQPHHSQQQQPQQHPLFQRRSVSFDDEDQVHEFDDSYYNVQELWYSTRELSVLKEFARQDARPMTTTTTSSSNRDNNHNHNNTNNTEQEQQQVEVSLGSDYRLVIQTLWDDCQQLAAEQQEEEQHHRPGHQDRRRRAHHRRSRSAPSALLQFNDDNDDDGPIRDRRQQQHYQAWWQQATPEFLGLERYLRRLRQTKQDNLAQMRKHMQSVGQFAKPKSQPPGSDPEEEDAAAGRRRRRQARHKRCASYNDYAYHIQREEAARQSIAHYCQTLSLPSRLMAQSMGALLAESLQQQEQEPQDDALPDDEERQAVEAEAAFHAAKTRNTLRRQTSLETLTWTSRSSCSSDDRDQDENPSDEED